MTFEEWRATRKCTDSIGDEVGTTCGEGPGYVYAGGCFIEHGKRASCTDRSGQYFLTIENWSAQSSDLEFLERELWARWAQGEVEAARQSNCQ
jgi:hypothetical protein